MLNYQFCCCLIRCCFILSLAGTQIVQTAHAQSRDAVTELNNARKVYVPIEDLDVVIERDKEGVILPRATFDGLIAAAKDNRLKNPVPTGDAVVMTNAEYATRIAGDQLLIRVTAELNQFDAGWHETRFPLQRLALEQVHIDDAPAFVGRNSDGSVSLLTNERGKHLLKLQLSTELNSQGSDQVAGFSLLPAATGWLTLTLPVGKRLVLGSLQLERPASLDQVADYRVAVGGMNGLQLRITDRATENSADSLTFATTGYGLHVAPGEVTWHAATTLQVFGKAVDRLTFRVPSQVEITEVESTGLETWSLSDEPNHAGTTSISLNYGQAFEGTRKISFKGVMAIPAGDSWSVPPLQMSGATSQIGRITIRQAAGVRVQVVEAIGVRRAMNDAKPNDGRAIESVVSPIEEITQFDVWQPDFVLRLATQAKQREVHAAVATVIDVNSTGLEIQSAVTLITQFAPLFEVDIRLPFEWHVVSVQRGDQMLRWQIINLEEPGQVLLRILLDVPLPTDGKAQVRLALRRDVEGWPVDVEPIVVNLPDLFLPQASLTEGAVVIRGDDDLELAAFDLQGLNPRPLKADFERLRFETQDGHLSGKLKVSRKPSRIAVQTVAVGRIDPQTVHTFLQAAVEVQGGGVRTLKVAMPESTGTAIRFESPGAKIVEQKAAAPQNGERVWTVQFDQRLRGPSWLFCDLESAHENANEFHLPQWRFVEADRQNGYTAIEAGAEQRLTIVAKEASGATLFEVDPLELPEVHYHPKERIVAVFRSVAPGAVITIGEQKLGKLSVPSAVCPLLEVATILARTGELQHQATFRLNATGVQGLHVLFPQETTLWATLVDGHPVEVRRNGDVYLVPLVSNASQDPSADRAGAATNGIHRIQFFYRSEVSSISSFGTLVQRPPTLTVESGQRTALRVEVLEQKWEVHYPPETQLVDSHGPLEALQPFDDVSLLGRLNASVHMPSTMNIGVMILAILVTVGVVVLLTSPSRERRSLVVVIALVGVLGAVSFVVLASFMPNERSASMRYVSASNANPSQGHGVIPDAKAPALAIGKSLNELGYVTKGKALEPDGRPKPQAPVFGEEIAQEQKDDAHLAVKGQNGPAAGKNQWSDTQGGTDRRGLMSLAIDFNPPADNRTKAFGYVGADSSAGGIPLEVDYVDAQSGEATRLFVIALCAMFAWFLRKVNVFTKIGVATIGCVIPLALVPLAPIGSQVFLDGLLFGTIAAVLVWLLCSWACCCTCSWMNAPWSRVRTAVVPLFLGVALINPLQADDKKAGATANLEQTPSLTIPYQADTEPLASQRVFLSQEQFRELYRLANPDKPGLFPAPREGGIVDAFYAAKLVPNAQKPESSVVEIKARYAVRSFVNRQLVVDLPISDVSAREAKLDGRAAALLARGHGFQVAIADSGMHVLDLTFDVPARLSGSAGSFAIPLMPVPAGKLSFALPAKDLSVRVNGSSTVYRRVTQDSSQSIELPVDKGGDIAITWQPEQSRHAAASVVQVDSVQAITLTDAGCVFSQSMAYRVRQGGFADVTVVMPETLRLQSVGGPDVGGWELAGEGATRKLRIIFRRNVTDQTRLTIEAFLDIKVQEAVTLIALPQIIPQEISNEIGQIAVFAGDQFSIRAEQVESLVQIDNERFATSLPTRQPNEVPRLVYRFTTRPYALTLRATRQEPQAQVTALDASFVTTHKQQLTTRFRYELTGAPRSSISIALPNEFVLLEVQATDMRDWYITTQDGQSRLTVDLSEPKLGKIELDVNGYVPRDSAVAAIQFPQPIDATRLESIAAVWFDEGLSGVLDSFESWRSIDASQIDAGLRAVRAQQSPQFAFSSSQLAPAPVTLRLTPVTPKIRADSLSMVTVTDLSVVYTLALQWQVEAARTDSFSLTTPKWLAGKLEFRGEGIRETTFADAGDDRTRWTINLRAPMSGKYFVTATAALAAPATEVQAPVIRFEREQTPINLQRHYVLLINSSSSQLNTVDTSATTPVQPEDLPLVVEREFIDQATELVQMSAKDTTPKWTVHKFDQQAGIPASVNLADLTTVVSRDGTYRSQAIYTIKNRTRQFLAIKLPEQTELLSVYVAGQASRAVTTQLASVNGATVQLIALPKKSAASLSFPVKIVWSGRLKRALPTSNRLTRDELDIPAPQIIGQQEDPEFGIPVARTRWTVYLPGDLDAQASRSIKVHNLSLTDGADRLSGQAIVQETSDLLDFLSQSLGSNPSRGVRENRKQIELATNNLKQLSQTLNQYHIADPTFEKEKTDVLNRMSELQRLVEQNRSSPTISVNGIPNSGQVNLGIAELAEGDFIANQQRDSLIVSNGGYGLLIKTEPAEANFSFDSNQIAREELKPRNRESAKPPSSQQESKNENRARLRMSNETSIDDLNSVVTSNNTIRQQSRELQQQRGKSNNGLVGNSLSQDGGNQIPARAPLFRKLRDGAPDPLANSTPQNQDPTADADTSLDLNAKSGLFEFRLNEGVLFGGRAAGQMMAQQPDAGKVQPDGQVGAAGLGTGRSVRGLSLDIELPTSGQKLVFSKVGGDPKLALLVRSETAIRSGINLIWSGIWIAVAVLVLVTIRLPSAKAGLEKLFPFVATSVGMIGFCTLPMPLNLVAFGLMLVGIVLLVRRYQPIESAAK